MESKEEDVPKSIPVIVGLKHNRWLKVEVSIVVTSNWRDITVVPVPLVLDLRIAHDRVGSSTDPTLYGHLKYPNNLDQSLNDTVADKVRKYRVDYNNNPPNTRSVCS